MRTVKHKKFGIGEVIQINDNHLTVRFQNDGSERIFAIPQSFQMGFLTAEGIFEKEIESLMLEFLEAKNESIKLKNEEQKERLIECLAKSENFYMVHKYISHLSQYETWSEKQVEELCNAAFDNDQIQRIFFDEDVFAFYQKVLNSEMGLKSIFKTKLFVLEKLNK